MRPISIHIPGELFIEFAARVKGDPSEEIEHMIRKHLAKLDEIVVDTELFARVTTVAEFEHGRIDGGIEWTPLWLPNGTELRMRYRHQNHFARVRFDTIHYGGQEFGSVSQWVRQVARGTARNAWHDVWVKFPEEDEFVYSDALRQVPRTGMPANGETPDQRIRRLSSEKLLEMREDEEPDDGTYSEE